MNPYELEKIAKQRTGEIRETVTQRRTAAARRGHGKSIRHRTGWALIKLGLSVIPTAKDGTGFAQAVRPQLSRPRPAR